MLRESEWGGKRHAAMPGEGLAIRSGKELLTASPRREVFSKTKK